jgi:hypothetical protein
MMNWTQYPVWDVAQIIQTRKRTPPATDTEFFIRSVVTTGEPMMLQAITP